VLAAIGPKAATVTGLVLLAAGVAWLALIDPDGSHAVGVLPAFLVAALPQRCPNGAVAGDGRAERREALRRGVRSGMLVREDGLLALRLLWGFPLFGAGQGTAEEQDSALLTALAGQPVRRRHRAGTPGGGDRRDPDATLGQTLPACRRRAGRRHHCIGCGQALAALFRRRS
jgi:hypothetical protein